MRSLLTAAAAGLLLVAAFPPYGLAFLTVPAVAIVLATVRVAPSRWWAAWAGGTFGVIFFGLLFHWIGELGAVALVPLLVSQAAYPLVYAGLLWGVGRREGGDLVWFVAAVGGWALMELGRARFPLGGFEWGLLGYPMGEYSFTRGAAQLVGTSGWSVVLAAGAAGLVLTVERRSPRWLAAVLPIAGLALAGALVPVEVDGTEVRVAVVQGSSPCPGTHCPNEREQVYLTHLELTRTLEAGAFDLVVWPEGSSGGPRSDPVLHPEVGAAIAAEARRIGAAFLVGSDRILNDAEWVNANVVWNEEGEMIGEYRKRHPVPFGEYVPARPMFAWIPALSQVPRDMIPGREPVTFEMPWGTIGSVISFESSFARYPRDMVLAGADLLVVATSQASYPTSVASDQLIGMTRMRAAELGVDVVHASVSGHSTLITDGGVVGEETPLAEPAVITGVVEVADGTLTLYARWGDWLQVTAALALVAALAANRGRAQKVS